MIGGFLRSGLYAITALLVFSGVGFAQKAVPTRDQLEKIVQAKSAYLLDVTTGTILYERNRTKPYPPASTVKLMTALLTYEKSRLEGNVLVQPEDTQVEPSHVPLIAGEVVAVRDLVRALLVGSDNDSALALARFHSGSYERFVALMNDKAARLGCQRTRFVNPNGLPAAGQFTTATDLMKIFEAAIRIPELRRICQLGSIELDTRAGHQIVKNHNKLLGKYPGMGPAKTGWTYASKHTYAASATREGRELHLILLNSTNKWVDAQALFDYGFANLPILNPEPVGPPVPMAPKPTTGSM
ncbi:MAG: serine hydrolase [Verrucomicrobiota bacterium]